MISKVYDKVKTYLKEFWQFFLIILISFLIFTYEFPYYIDTPGGLMDLKEKIEIDNSYQSDGSFNLAYVSELKATIPTLTIALLHPDWDILKESDILDDETMKDLLIREKLMLQEALCNATLVAYKKANKEVVIENEEVYVTYKAKDAITTLKIGDQILSVNGIKIDKREQLLQITEKIEVGKKIEIEVLYDGKKETRTAMLQQTGDKKIIGVVLTKILKLKTTPKIEFHFSKNESGPSGGLMTTLSIYDMLIEEDLTKGYSIVGTGTIDLDGTVGSIGGVKYKLKGAVKKGAKIFFVPVGENYQEALKVKKEKNYDIQIVPVETVDDALEYLRKL